MEIEITTKRIMGAWFGLVAVTEIGEHVGSWSLLVEPPSREDAFWTFRDVVDRGEAGDMAVAFDAFIERSTRGNITRVGFCATMLDVVLPALRENRETILETLEMEFMPC